jgi:hypothetical protein
MAVGLMEEELLVFLTVERGVVLDMAWWRMNSGAAAGGGGGGGAGQEINGWLADEDPFKRELWNWKCVSDTSIFYVQSKQAFQHNGKEIFNTPNEFLPFWKESENDFIKQTGLNKDEISNSNTSSLL